MLYPSSAKTQEHTALKKAQMAGRLDDVAGTLQEALLAEEEAGGKRGDGKNFLAQKRVSDIKRIARRNFEREHDGWGSCGPLWCTFWYIFSESWTIIVFDLALRQKCSG